MNFDMKLVAYEPFGERIGVLPEPIHIEAGVPLSDGPSMRIKYSQHSNGAEHLERPIEVALELLNPNTGNWFEPYGGRFVNIRNEGDRVDAAGVIDYVLPGYPWLLSKVSVYPFSKQYIDGQVGDAEATEKSKRDVLNKAEDAVTKSLGYADSAAVEFAPNAPTNQKSVWIDTSGNTAVTKIYWNNNWVASASPAAQDAGKAAMTAWVAHQESQGQLRDVQAQARLTKRSFNGKHPGAVLAILIDEARKRGERLGGLVTKFTETHDSSGNPWPTFPGTVEVNVGSDLGKILTTFVEGGQLDYRTLKRELQVFVQGKEMERQLDRSNTLRYGLNIDEAPDRSTYEEIAGEVLFIGDEGLSFTRSNPEAPRPWGVWETSVSQSGVKSEGVGDRLARNMLAQSSRQRVERTRALHFMEGVNAPLPFVHYLPGDFVHAPNSKGLEEPQRVQQITLTRDGKTGAVGGNLVLNDRLLEREIRNARTTDALMGGAGSIGGTGGQRQQESYVDYRTPAAPQYVALTSEANYVRDIGYQAYLGAEWYWSGRATNGTAMPDGVAHFQLQYRMFQEGTTSQNTAAFAWVTVPNVAGAERTTIFGPVDAVNQRINQPAIYQVRARAFGVNGRVSDWSKVASIKVDLDTQPPEAPSRPKAFNEGSVIYVSWDGKNHLGGNPPADFLWTRVEEASVPAELLPDAEGNYTDEQLNALDYTEATPYHLMGAGEALVMEREYNKKFVYRLVMVDLFGNESEPSAPSGPTAATPLVDDAYIQEQLDYARQQMIQDQAELTSKLAAHDTAIAEAKLDLEALGGKLTAAEAELTTLDTTMGTLDGKLTTLDGTLSGVAQQQSLAATQAENEARRLDGALSNLSTVSKDLDLLEGNFASVSEAATHAEASAAAAEAEALRATTAAGEAASKFSELDSKLTAALAAKPGLITDSSFELPDNWATAYGSRISAGPGARTGESVLFFPMANTGPNGLVHFYSNEAVDVIEGHIYTFTTYLRRGMSAAPTTDEVNLIIRDHGTNTYVTLSARAKLSELGVNSEWTRVTGSWQATKSGLVNFGYQARALTSDLYVDDFQVVDSTAEASLKLQVEQALKDAQNAAKTAQAAATAANTAQQSADGKTTTYYRTEDATGFGLVDGDTWYKTNPTTGIIIGHWRWSAANKKWLPQKVDGAQLANFDAGYITSGYLDVAQRIKAGSINADKMLIGVGDNMIPWNGVLNDHGIDPHSGHGDGVMQVLARAGYNRHLWVTSEAATGWRYIARLRSGGQSIEGNGHSFPIVAGKSYRFETMASLGGTYTEGAPQVRICIAWRAQGAGGWLKYSWSDAVTMDWAGVKVASTDVAPPDAVAADLFVQIDRPGGARIIDPSFREMTDGSLIVNGSVKAEHIEGSSVAGEVAKFIKVDASNINVTGALTTNILNAATASAKNLFITGNASMTGKTWIENLAAQKIAAASIDVGQITGKDAYFNDLAAKKIAASSITTSQITGGSAWVKNLAANEITSASIKVSQLTSLNSNFDEAVVNKLWAQKIAAGKISANEIIVGSGANLIVNGFGELGDSTNFTRFSRSDSASLNSPTGSQSTFWTSSQSGLQTNEKWQVIPGRTYYWQLWTMGQNTGQRCYVQVNWYDAAGSRLSGDYVVSNQDPGTGSWKFWSGQVQAPDKAVTANYTLYANHSNGTQQSGQWQRWGGLVFQDAADGRLIVDGSITTEHIAARYFDVSKLLKANEIKADKIDVASLKSKMITSTTFQGGTYYGGAFITEDTGKFATHRAWNRGFQATSKGVSMYNSSGQRVMNLDAGTGDSDFTGQFRTGLPGKPSIIVSSANNSWNNKDQGVWFTADGNAYGWGNSAGQPPAAGVFTLSNPQQWASDVPLQLRGHGSGGVVAWEALTLRSMVGGGGVINVPSGSMLTRVASGGYTVDTSGGMIFDGNGHTRMNVGGSAGFYLGSKGYVRYNKNSASGGTVRMANDGCIVVAFSTRKLKENIRDAEADERVLDIQPRNFYSKPAWDEYRELQDEPHPMPEAETRRLDALSDDLREQYGVIAEEIEELGLTDLVFHDEVGDPSSVNYELIGLKLLPFVKVLWEDYKARTAA